YKQQSYTVVQEGYGYPQTCYPQTAYPQTGYPQTGYPQTAYPYSSPVEYSSSSYNQCHQLPMESRPHGHSYDHNQGHKYEHQNQHHGVPPYSVGNMGFGGNQWPSHATGYGKYGKLYSAFKG
ncbi:hypothetical protein, partial [Vibrio vulnificus]|uniref:hypothetical protein n=1 Tax=Vibrio vulnificus TaxID=672 RepID=UPI0021E491E5